MLQVCRTCLHQISDTNFISLTSNSKSIEVKKQLAFCVPEMATNLVSEPIMCIPCVTALHSAYIFKNQCLRTEERIRNYMESQKIGINLHDLFEDPNNTCVTLSLEETCAPNEAIDEIDIYVKEEYIPTEAVHHDNNELKDNVVENNSETCVNENGDNFVQDSSPHQEKFQEIIKKKSKHITPGVARPHKCDKCPFSTNDRSTLNKHRSVHSDERPHQCTLCKYRTKRKDALTLHMKIHRDEKPYSCPECKYSAVTKQRLRTHVMVAHLELRPYKCERCDFSAAERGTIVKHMLTHSDVKPFQCKLCNFCTKRKYTLKKHMLSHGVG